jgi:hypothetical protein
MNASDLDAFQADIIYKRLRPAFDYLAALQRRMEEVGWEPTDRLYLEVKTARDAVQLLSMDVHRIMQKNWGLPGKSG